MYLHNGRQDKQSWLGEEDDTYSIKSTYTLLHISNRNDDSTWFRSFWSAKALQNTQTLTWRVIPGKLPTRKSLVRRWVRLNGITCPLCQQYE